MKTTELLLLAGLGAGAYFLTRSPPEQETKQAAFNPPYNASSQDITHAKAYKDTLGDKTPVTQEDVNNLIERRKTQNMRITQAKQISERLQNQDIQIGQRLAATLRNQGGGIAGKKQLTRVYSEGEQTKVYIDGVFQGFESGGLAELKKASDNISKYKSNPDKYMPDGSLRRSPRYTGDAKASNPRVKTELESYASDVMQRVESTGFDFAAFTKNLRR